MTARFVHGGRPGTEYGAAWWRAVYELYEEAFPGLPGAIEGAKRAGASWQEVSTPFVVMEGDRAIAHVGVIAHPMRLAGRRVEIAGIHAVCTAAGWRRQGLARRLLADALGWCAGTYALAKLHTDLPQVYRRHGFKTVPTYRFRTELAPEKVEPRLLAPDAREEDAQLIREMLAKRTPVSDRCASVDSGWMEIIVASLSGLAASGFYLVEEHDAIVVFGEERGQGLIVDVIAERVPPAAVVLGAAPDWSVAPLWAFSPDRFEVPAEADLAPPESGAFMVRGRWPVAAPFGISPLWEH